MIERENEEASADAIRALRSSDLERDEKNAKTRILTLVDYATRRFLEHLEKTLASVSAREK